MRVLWFEVTEPSAYKSFKEPIGGWQDSLERIVRTVQGIELTVVFVSEKSSEVKVINGVTYVPILIEYGIVERYMYPYWDLYVKKVIPIARQIVEKYQPDLIQIFGLEWPFGQIAAFTNVPIVIHIMGSIVPYNNANYPPGFSYRDMQFRFLCNPQKLWKLYRIERDNKSWERWERSTWGLISNYMGRTQWDESLSRIMHPGCNYFHVEEALRLPFIKGNKSWSGRHEKKIRLISTGCSTFWKGPDLMLKVARILTSLDVDFEWNVAGNMSNQIKDLVERKVGVSFEACHVNIMGYLQADKLIDFLCSSTMYVHTAYIENSPNSICEAQYLGVPVVSTNIGGISTLVRNGIDGVLVPANDPWQMADAIIQLAADEVRMHKMSVNSLSFAKARHNDENIKSQLLKAYYAIIKAAYGTINEQHEEFNEGDIQFHSSTME